MTESQRSTEAQLLDSYRLAKLIQAATQPYGKPLLFTAGLLILLPILAILLLPQVIFNGLVDSPEEDFILNDPIQIAVNVIAIRDNIQSILQEEYEAVLSQIEEQQKDLEYTELVDAVSGQITFNAFTILSVYCAYQGAEDFTQINIDHLAAQVDAHREDYFWYETATEVRTEMVPREVDGETVQVPEQHRYTIFTLKMVEESYFSDTLWPVSEKETQLALNYASNLSLYLYELKEQADIEILGEIQELLGDNDAPIAEGIMGNPFNDPNWRSYITSGFGLRADVGIPGANTTNHNGVDLARPYGTPILAVQCGRVITAATHYSYGNYVVIDHGGGICTLYAHCSQLLVSAGATVSKYDTIAKVGSTGDSTGNHLHICVIVNGQYVNPMNHLH